MHSLGFELTIQVFERTKAVHALNRTATVMDKLCINCAKFFTQKNILHFKY
jgi:hypothetical protein